MKPFDTALLYYLSGTGNTYRVACWIKGYLDENGIKTSLNQIEDAEIQGNFHNNKAHTVDAKSRTAD